MTAEIDTSRAGAALEGLSDALGTDASELVRDESRRLIRTITNITPPGAGGGARRLGERAVERDLKNLFSEASTSLIDEVGSKYGLKDIHTAYVTEKSGTRLQLDWNAIDPTGSRMPDYHKANRDSRGRVKLMRRESKTIWSSRVVVPLGTRDPYIAKIKARVGRWKASWAAAGARLGDSYPNWIARHFGSVDDISIVKLDGLTNKERPSITFGSKAAGNSRIRSLIENALAIRTKAMVARTKLVLSGYAKNVAQGIRPRSGQVKGGAQEGVE